MDGAEALRRPVLKKMVQRLGETLGARIRCLALYGSAARGEYHEGASDFNLIIVLEDLSPATLEALAPAVNDWVEQGQPPPRLLTPALLRDAADVFPIEFSDLRDDRVVVQGEDPFAGLQINHAALRLQCERELREKLMRLREGYIEAHASRVGLRLLLADSYTTFVALFRGCLRLQGGPVPAARREVVAAFCARAGLAAEPFEAIDRLKGGAAPGGDLKSLFARYYVELTKAVGVVDRFDMREGGSAR
jgi:predicted nucleotidyltransferase